MMGGWGACAVLVPIACSAIAHSITTNIARIRLSQALSWPQLLANSYEARSTAFVIARRAKTAAISERYSLEPWISDTNSRPSAATLAASAIASSSSLLPLMASPTLCSNPPMPPSDSPSRFLPTRAASTASARVGYTEAPVITTLAAVQVPSLSNVITAAHPTTA